MTEEKWYRLRGQRLIGLWKGIGLSITLVYLITSLSTVSFRVMFCCIKWKLQNNTGLNSTEFVSLSCDGSPETGRPELLYQGPEGLIYLWSAILAINFCFQNHLINAKAQAIMSTFQATGG